MSSDKKLSEEKERELPLTVHQEMVIADSPSGGEPSPLFPEKTPEETKFVETYVKLFTNAIDSI